MSSNAYKIYFTLLLSILLFSLSGYGFTTMVGLLPKEAEYLYNASAISFVLTICSLFVFLHQHSQKQIND